jgi:hypothetical protein
MSRPLLQLSIPLLPKSKNWELGLLDENEISRFHAVSLGINSK